MITDRMKGTEETEKKGKEERRARWATCAIIPQAIRLVGIFSNRKRPI